MFTHTSDAASSIARFSIAFIPFSEGLGAAKAPLPLGIACIAPFLLSTVFTSQNTTFSSGLSVASRDKFVTLASNLKTSSFAALLERMSN